MCTTRSETTWSSKLFAHKLCMTATATTCSVARMRRPSWIRFTKSISAPPTAIRLTSFCILLIPSATNINRYNKAPPFRRGLLYFLADYVCHSKCPCRSEARYSHPERSESPFGKPQIDSLCHCELASNQTLCLAHILIY